MTDTRFTTVVDDADELLSVMDVDELGDVETLLMSLFARPVSVGPGTDDDGAETALEVIVYGDGGGLGSTYEFPVSMMELARSLAPMADELGPYSPESLGPGEAADVAAMSDAELITALQQALGMVRLVNMMGEGE